jgi:hypothetical protein
MQATPLIDGSNEPQATPDVTLTLATTDGSLWHWLMGRHLLESLQYLPAGAKAYVVAIVITYFPLVLCACLMSPLPVAEQTATLHLPFLYDSNVAFMFLVSFPSLLALTVTDQHVLDSALRRVQIDGTVSVPKTAAIALSSLWRRRFRSINMAAQALGAGTGVLLALFNYRAYTRQEVGFWIASENRLLLPLGAVFLWCIFLFYSLLPIYILRNFAFSVLMKDLVGHAQIRMLPFHPDKSGGLRPMGHLGLRNQYGLTVCGVNVVLLVFVSFHYHLKVLPPLYGLMTAAGVAYLLVGPLVFMGPLLPFRAAMLRTKSDLMSEVAKRLRIELERLRQQLATSNITKEDEELIDRLRKVGTIIDELPVWPFDAGTLRKFLTAYVIPPVGAALLKSILDSIVKRVTSG